MLEWLYILIISHQGVSNITQSLKAVKEEKLIEDDEVKGLRKKTRATKSAKKALKPKFQEEREGLIKPITAKNDNQKKYLDSLQKNLITVGQGSAGTGKTYLAARVASQKYLKNEIQKIVVMRPLVGMGKSSGFWPGTITEKIEPYLLPILNTIKSEIGINRYSAEYGKSIVIQPMEAVRGMSFDEKTFIIVDEAQNCTPEEIRSLVTRLEEGAMLAFCGDDRQKDLRGLSGIEYLSSLITKHSLPKCGVVKFTSDDIVRSGLTRRFVEIFDKEGACPQ